MTKLLSFHFPDELTSAIQRLEGTLAIGKVGEAELTAVLNGLGSLPPQVVVPVGRRLANITSRASQLQRHSNILMFRRPSEAELLAAHPELAWLFLFHCNGYLREAALDQLSTPPNAPFLLGALALRLNDWVPQVRQAAVRAVDRLLSKTQPDVIAGTAAFLLARRFTWTRWSNEAGVLDRGFQRPDAAAHLARLLLDGRTGPLASTLRHLLRLSVMDEYLGDLARAALQPTVRAVALATLIRGRASWPTGFGWEWVDKSLGERKRVTLFGERDIKSPVPMEDLIRQGLADRSPMVRRVAADGLIQHRTTVNDVSTLASRLVRDRSPSVRERGEFLLRQLQAGPQRGPRRLS